MTYRRVSVLTRLVVLCVMVLEIATVLNTLYFRHCPCRCKACMGGAYATSFLLIPVLSVEPLATVRDFGLTTVVC